VTDSRTKLIALLTRLGALDLAGQLWTVRDVRELPDYVRAAIVDVLGYETAARGVDGDGRNGYGRELDALAQVLLDE